MSGPDSLTRPLAQRVEALRGMADVPSHPRNDSTEVIEAASDALARGETHYTDRAGIMPLRTLVSERLASQCGISVEPKAVTITCGQIEATSIAVRVLGKPQTDIVCPSMFPGVIGVAHLIGARVVPHLGQASTVSLAYLTPGDPPEQIATLVQSSPYIVWDLSVLGYAPHPAQDPAIAQRVTTVNSLDGILPGWRVGWIAGSEMPDRLRGFKQALTICTTSVSQWAALAWLKSN
jgi:aspartate/methionine/tyrosine aminotransferase